MSVSFAYGNYFLQFLSKITREVIHMGFFFFNHKLSPIHRTRLLSRGIYFKDHQQTVHLSKKERKNCG